MTTRFIGIGAMAAKRRRRRKKHPAICARSLLLGMAEPREPLLCGGDIGLGETVAGWMCVKRDVGATGPEVRGQAVRMISRNEWILRAARDQDVFAFERMWGRRRIDHDHRTKKNGAGENHGAQL